MNSKYFGDSYDLVKWLLLECVSNVGSYVYTNPMFTDDNAEYEDYYYSLIKTNKLSSISEDRQDGCLFFDPETGLSYKNSKRHVTFTEILQKLFEGYRFLFI